MVAACDTQTLRVRLGVRRAATGLLLRPTSFVSMKHPITVMNSETQLIRRTRCLCAALAGVSLLALAACAHHDKPVLLPGVMTPQRSSRGLVGENAGVRVVARVKTWNGDPPTLSQYVLPIWIQIENRSGKALLLRYSALSMGDLNDSQVALSAVPPVRVRGEAIIPVSAVPPEFGLQDPWMGTWLEPGVDDNLARSMQWRESLPTREMLRRAIREGVVADGGRVAGFVYFPRTKQDPATFTLRADFVDAATNQSFGRIEIPLEVRLD